MENKINFKSLDGTNLVGIHSFPEITPKGIFLMIHGLPSDKDEWGFFKDFSAFFSLHGYSSFRFDLRFNGESEKGNYSDLLLITLIEDIESAYKEIEKLNHNNLPIYILGTSCGGGITIKWINESGRKFPFIFLSAPVFDYFFEFTGITKVNFVNEYNSLTKQMYSELLEKEVIKNENEYGFEMLKEALQFDGFKELEQFKLPTVLYQGDIDTIVPYEMTVNYIQKHENIKLVVINGADHGFGVVGDDYLTFPETKENHYFVFNDILNTIENE